MIYPEQPNVNRTVTFHYRPRIVIPCWDTDQAERIMGQVADICGGYLEYIVAMVDDGVILSETVIRREGFGVNVAVPLVGGDRCPNPCCQVCYPETD